MLLGAAYRDSDSGSSISLSMVMRRNSRFPYIDSATYLVPDDATVNIFLTI